MNNVNRSSVNVNLKDVHGQTITDQVELKFYNQRAQSLNQRFVVNFVGHPVSLPGAPAFPFGLAEVFINPKKYRYKSIFINVPAGQPGTIDEIFFVDPGEVKPSFPIFAEIQTGPGWLDLWRVLQKSGVADQAGWDALKDQEKAGLLNLHAKMKREVVDGGREVISFVEQITEFHPARIFAMVQKDLRDLVRSYAKAFHVVPGALHDLGQGWNLVDSLKTFDAAGNLQLTFATNATGEWKADIDIDDHQGIEHAFDVLKHTITNKDTHPYDIHEILIYFQELDPGYQLV